MKRKYFNDPNHAHYLTFSCFHRLQLLTHDTLCRELVEFIDQARTDYNFNLWAWVIMPEHVHLLIRPTAHDYSTTRITSSIKAPFARRLIAHWREHTPHKLQRLRTTIDGRPKYRFWQAGGGFDKNLYQIARIRKTIEYIEYNPVRRGFVTETTDWRWSSAQARAGYSSAVLAIDEITWELACSTQRT